MCIGTAKPVGDEQGGVSHHFIDFLSVKEPYSVGDYERDVDLFLKDYFKKNDIAVLVGGAGLFIDAVCQGLDEFPETDGQIRNLLNAQFAEEGISPLLEKLKEIDSSYYAVVDKSNHRRIIRALEVCISSGKPFSSFLTSNSKKDKYPVIRIGLKMDRELLNEQINMRVDDMMERGLLEEVNSLIEYNQLQALQTVGYAELFNYIKGDHTLEEAVEQIKHNTRKYGKRQVTWFKKNKAITWFPVDHIEKIISFIDASIGESQ